MDGTTSRAAGDRASGDDVRSLIGRSVNLTISDPWDFGSVHGNGPFRARIVDVTPDHGEKRGGALLVRLLTPLWYQGNVCEHLIATPRSGSDGFRGLGRRETIQCGFVSISPQGAKSASPFDLTWWRGWGTLLGTLDAS